jgi:hypothetical protein
VHTGKTLTGQTHGASRRNVKKVSRGKPGTRTNYKKRGGKGRQSAKTSMLKPGEKLHTGSYSADAYRKLTDDPKYFIRAARLEENKTNGAEGKRMSSAIARDSSSDDTEEEDTADEDEPPRKQAKHELVTPKVKKNAGDQFGRKAHQVVDAEEKAVTTALSKSSSKKAKKTRKKE